MKTIKFTRKVSRNTSRFSSFFKMALMTAFYMGTVINPANAEDSDHASQYSQIRPAKKSTDGKGKLPTFAQADINGDHVVTKSELQNFPYLLQTFDKVDAGNDGKLEQHEYQNLKMETKREGEVR